MEPETAPTAAAPRPGPLLRFFRYPLVQAIVGALMVLAAAAVATGAASAAMSSITSKPPQTVLAVVVALAVVAAWKAYKRWVERETDSEYPLRRAAPELAIGLLAGLAVFSVMTGFVWLLGGIRFEGMRGIAETQLDYWAFIAIVSGFTEETLFRGLLFRAVEKIGGSWIALAVTSAFFGLGHIFNPNSSWFAAFAIAVEAGILLGAAYMLTRRLWLAVGMHAGWNFTQGWVFSVPVSGGRTPIGLIRTTREGPDWLTGAGFGLEASAVAMVVATAVGLLILWLAYRSGRFVAPPWRRG